MAARATYLVAGTLVGLIISALPSITHADDRIGPGDLSEDVVSAANEAGVSVVDLLGAMSTSQSPPRAYLISVGELPPPDPPLPPVPRGPVLAGAVARADCIIGKESGGLDIPNRQGSGATGPGQYFPSTWARHSALYRQATGYGGPLSMHSLHDVRVVMAWMLSAHPGSRSEWVVGGC